MAGGTYRHRRSVLFAILGAAALVAPGVGMARAGETEDALELVDVFTSGTEGYHTFRIPALLVTRKGTLLAFCEGRKTGRGDHGDLDLVLKRSEDGGRTWSALRLVHEEGGTAKITIGNPCPVGDRDTGAIWLPFCRNNDDVLVTRSDDDGRTWSKPREITRDVKGPGWGWYATGPGVGIQLRRGPHEGRLVIPCDHREKVDGRWVKFSHVFYSDDHGATWRLGGSVAPHTDECQVVEAADGSLLINMRNYWAREGGRRERGGMRAVATSRDGGLTWTNLRFDAALIEPICQASFLRYTSAREGGRNRLLFSNPASKRGRDHMTVRLSYDEGKTWPVHRLIYEGSAAYSCLTVLPDLRIGLLFERDDYRRIAFTAFSLAWLAGGADRLEAGPAVPPRSKYLLLDDRIVARAEGARLAPGTVRKHPANPLFREDLPWETRFDNLYPNVLRDPESGRYRCWYSPFVYYTPSSRAKWSMPPPPPGRPKRLMAVCYAESDDGLRWRKPIMDIQAFEGRRTNMVLLGPHGTGVFRDDHETVPARRYKMFFKSSDEGVLAVAFSPDGLRWSKPHLCPEARARADTHNNALWAPELGRYVGITRLWDGQRIVGRTESRDFLHWTKAVEVLRGNRKRQTYAMPTFRHAGLYLGLLMIFRTDEDRVHCELAWSPDTMTWHRIAPGTPFIPNATRKGAYDWGCVYAGVAPVFLEDEIRIYYGASDGTHYGRRKGYLALATLRPDGFAGYAPADPARPGTVTTRPLLCTARKLRVTADAAGGSIRAAVVGAEGLGLADCRPVTGNVTDAPVRWSSGADLSALRGRPVRLRFELARARLYAFGFAD